MNLQAVLPESIVDARVRVAPVPAVLPGAQQLTDWLSATVDEALFQYAGIRMLVRGTEEVVIDHDHDADVDVVAPLLYGAAIRALLLHAGLFSLHATLIRHDGSVVALAGNSGAGKTTTAAALSHLHGATVLVDDVVPTRVLDGRTQALVLQRPLHLARDAVERLQLELTDAHTLHAGPHGKLAVSATRFGGTHQAPAWVDLDRLVALSVTESAGDIAGGADKVVVAPVSGAYRLRWIVRVSNATGLPTLGARSNAYFVWAAATADSLPMIEIVRPDLLDTVSEVCAAVINRTPTSANERRPRDVRRPPR